MSRAQIIAIVGGLVITIIGMTFGLYYALLAEHQALEGMGMALTHAFSMAAQGRLDAALQVIQRYGEMRLHYIQNVHVHTHWSSLGLFVMALGFTFGSLNYSERATRIMALGLVIGAFVFPFGVLFDSMGHKLAGEILSVSGSILLLAALASYAIGIIKRSSEA